MSVTLDELYRMFLTFRSTVQSEGSGYVLRSKYGAGTLLVALSDSTPIAKTFAQFLALVGLSPSDGPTFDSLVITKTINGITITSLPYGFIMSGGDSAKYLTIDETTSISSKAAKNISVNEQTDSYTLVLTDAEKMIDMYSATATTLTIPKNSAVAFPVGSIVAVRQKGVGVVTIAPVDTDVTINAPGDLETSGQYTIGVLVKIGTDIWEAAGFGYEPEAEYLTAEDVHAAPVLGASANPISSNWAYVHNIEMFNKAAVLGTL